AQPGADLVGFTAGVDGYAAVALLRGRVAEEGLVAVDHELRRGQLVLLGLGLLYAEQVRVLFAEPVEKALAGRRTDPVGVEADDAHVLPVVCEGEGAAPPRGQDSARSEERRVGREGTRGAAGCQEK